MDPVSTDQIVLDVLQRASSQNPEILKPAEAKLVEWEIQPGFYTVLSNIISNHNIDITVRWMAVLYFKNGIDKYWRRNAPHAISEDEKISLKRSLISNFSEPIQQIATQKAVLVSKIARSDCPKEWPELLPTLIQAVESSDSLIQHRGLLTLHNVIKALSSKRLAGDRRLFQEFASNIYTFILNLWNNFTESFFRNVAQNNNFTESFFRNVAQNVNSEMLTVDLEKALLTLRILRKLTIHGFYRPYQNEGCMSFLKCFNLIKGILLCAEYRPAKVLELTKDPETVRAHQIKTNFFQPNTLAEICKKLVSHYFILTQDELDMWDNDPENFANDEAGESWKYSIRPSMESVFVTLFHEYRDTLAPILLEMIRETNCMVSPEDMAGILRKDAVYNAVGLAAYDMYDEVDFDQWFLNTLIEELKIKHNNYRVIRRRVSSLIGNWTGIKLSLELRPALYECVTSLLESTEDMAVRLTASTSLRHAIDDFEFNSEQFRPYLDKAFNLLFSLLKEAKECETKMHVLNVMTLIVERVGQTISPHTGALMHYLPLLWGESEDHNMLRVAIVATLVQLVRALGHVSAELNPFLIPVIQLGTDANQSAIVYLLEDSLELWLTVLENSCTMTPQFMQLFDNMPALLENSSENLRLCLIICIAHMLLDPENVMQVHGRQIINACDSLMADMRPEGIIMLSKVVEMFIKAKPVLGCETVRPLLIRIFDAVYKGEDMPLLMSMYLSVISRVLLSSHAVFRETLTVLTQTYNKNEQSILSTMLSYWLMKMRNVSNMEQRKLLGLALANLLTIQSELVLEKFNDILLNILETLNDITRCDDNGTMTDTLLLSQNQILEDGTSTDDQTQFQYQGHYPDESDYETDHEHRKNLLMKTDPVHTICLKDYLQSQIIELQRQVGQRQYDQLIQLVDGDTLQQLRTYITI
ncbi:Importin-beta N-terminal domain [Popillia japonica]|uniref:Importin-beta N-terminal domain n=1 Tax=Popillia japonica TaxID=7064 RepID=A0AAW1LS55_POPJA